MVNVYTNKYEESHGKKPYGKGYWAFKIGTAKEDFWVPQVPGQSAPLPAVYYSEAKRRAIAEAKKRGEHSITVLS